MRIILLISTVNLVTEPLTRGWQVLLTIDRGSLSQCETGRVSVSHEVGAPTRLLSTALTRFVG